MHFASARQQPFVDLLDSTHGTNIRGANWCGFPASHIACSNTVVIRGCLLIAGRSG